MSSSSGLLPLLMGIIAICLQLTLSQSPESQIIRYENKVFVINQFKKNWYGALHYCKFINMELASLESLEEHNFLEQTILDRNIREWYWIAGNDLEYKNTSEYYWANTGEKIEFFKWSEGEPNNKKDGDEHCIHMFKLRADGWNDRNCNDELPFICQTVVKK